MEHPPYDTWVQGLSVFSSRTGDSWRIGQGSKAGEELNKVSKAEEVRTR